RPALGLTAQPELNALHLHAAQRADEQAALPFGELVARIEREARRRDLRHPEHPRLLHAFAVPRLVRHERARVVAARRDERPAVVRAGLDDVDLVAAHRPDLDLPELARLGMPREVVTVAMAVAVDLGLRARAADERVAGRRFAFVREAQDLAD